MPESIYYQHRQIVEELRSQANMAERHAGAWQVTDEYKDDHQIAQWATDAILEEFWNLIVRQPESMPVVQSRFTWPADTASIALEPPWLDGAHPHPEQAVGAAIALQDETAGVGHGVNIRLVGRVGLAHLAHAESGPIAWRGLYGSVTQGRLTLEPFPAASFPVMLEYIALPDVVEPAGDGIYRGLPLGSLRATVSLAAGELVAVRKAPETLAKIGERRQKAAARARDRLERTGPEFTAWGYGI